MESSQQSVKQKVEKQMRGQNHKCLATQNSPKRLKTLRTFFVLCSAGKLQRDVYSQIYFDVSPGNGRQASSENRTQGGKPTLSESSKNIAVDTKIFD